MRRTSDDGVGLIQHEFESIYFVLLAAAGWDRLMPSGGEKIQHHPNGTDGAVCN